MSEPFALAVRMGMRVSMMIDFTKERLQYWVSVSVSFALPVLWWSKTLAGNTNTHPFSLLNFKSKTNNKSNFIDYKSWFYEFSHYYIIETSIKSATHPVKWQLSL